MQPVIYYNSKCSKSLLALQLLSNKGYTPRVIEYLVTPLQLDVLDKLSHLLNLSPVDMMRRQEKKWSELGLKVDSTLTYNQWLEVIIQHPILLQRPIVIHKNQAVIARPPEALLEII